MRKDILMLLQEAKEHSADRVSNFHQTLPDELIQASKENIEVLLPQRINSILDILNQTEGSEKHKPVNDLNEAINLFSSIEIEASIEKAISSIQFVSRTNQLTVQESLNDKIEGIEECVRILKLYTILPNLSHQNDVIVNKYRQYLKDDLESNNIN